VPYSTGPRSVLASPTVFTARQQLFLSSGAPTGRGVRVAVLDTGIDAGHRDLVGRFDGKCSRSFSLRGDLIDRNGHGSHIAGIIGGTGAASAGHLTGIAPECQLLVYQVADGRKGPEANAIAAIESAIADGAQVINFSHGYVPEGDPPWVWPNELSLLEEAFVRASEAGVVCVVAAGNAGPKGSSITRPGGLSAVITVGAVDRKDRVLPNSSRGPFRRSPDLVRNAPTRLDAEHSTASAERKPDIVAPGVITAPRSSSCNLEPDDDSEIKDPDYVTLAGSSQATAVVSGLAALVIEAANSRRIDLGADIPKCVRRLFICSAAALQGYSAADMGAGLVLWPRLAGLLEDFSADPLTRTAVLEGGEGALKLL
jgi:subtilisin family serine protease